MKIFLITRPACSFLLSILPRYFTDLLKKMLRYSRNFFAIEKPLILNKIFAILSILQREKLCSIKKQTLRYWNTFDTKKNLCYIISIVIWRSVQYWKTDSSLLKKAIEKILCCWKKSLHYWKRSFAIGKNLYAIEKALILKKIFAI